MIRIIHSQAIPILASPCNLSEVDIDTLSVACSSLQPSLTPMSCGVGQIRNTSCEILLSVVKYASLKRARIPHLLLVWASRSRVFMLQTYNRLTDLLRMLVPGSNQN